MSRSKFVCLALSVLCVLPVAGQVLPGPGPTTVLPLASVANWSALLLEGGILYTRVAGSADGPFFVFAAPKTDGRTDFLAYRGGADAAAAFGSLHAKLGLSGRDAATLKAFALGVPLVAAGTWDALTFGDGFVIAADPAMGDLGTRLYGALLVLEAGNFAANLAAATSKDAIAVEQHICQVKSWTAFEADGKVVSSAAASAFAKVLAVTDASTAKFLTAAKVCKGMADVFPFKPSFPILTPAIYPTITVPWKGSFCPVAGATGDCMNGLGHYCTSCRCVQAGDGGGGLWSPGNCTAVTSMPDGTACAPIGGEGPCDKPVGTPCKKNCGCVEANPPTTPPTGTWKCGSAEIAGIFLLLAGGLAWRRRLAA